MMRRQKVGKINDYDLYKSEEREGDGGDHVFVIKKAKEQAPLGELILTQSKGFLKNHCNCLSQSNMVQFSKI